MRVKSYAGTPSGLATGLHSRTFVAVDQSIADGSERSPFIDTATGSFSQLSRIISSWYRPSIVPWAFGADECLDRNSGTRTSLSHSQRALVVSEPSKILTHDVNNLSSLCIASWCYPGANSPDQLPYRQRLPSFLVGHRGDLRLLAVVQETDPSILRYTVVTARRSDLSRPPSRGATDLDPSQIGRAHV